LKKASYLLIACIIVVVVGGLYYFFKDEPFNAQVPVQTEEKSEPDSGLTYIGNNIVEERDGRRLWELNSELIEIDPDTNNARLKNIKGIFYKDNGEKILMTAPQGFINSKSQDVDMVGEIKAIDSDGATFTAHKVHWAGVERRFYGSEGIVFTRDDTVITGDKIESDANMEKITVQGNARVVKGGAVQ
jgi:LPS export ABC transporter protein LptC